VARCSTGSLHDHQRSAGAGLLQPGAPAQGVPQRLGGGDDQRLELPAGVRADVHDGGAGGVQHPDRLPVAALAWGGQVLAGQRLPAGADGVQGVALGAVAATRPLGPVDLDHPLAMVEQEAGQPGPVAPGPFQRPDPPAWRLRADQVQQPGMPGPVARHLEGDPHPAVGIQQRGGVGVAVGVDPDDGVDAAL